ncbi:MAG: NAD(P)H:quinone oxidoreductase [Deltaproteobacteria bacterium]|nr:NAD(P)H:quinone oxidoreductase [Deltaproteobacteria bacterium]
MKVNVIFHSVYGHVWKMAEAIAAGAKEAGADVSVLQVKETLTDDIIASMRATEAKKAFAHVPQATLDDLSEPDAVIFGTPTRFGNMSAQMRAFLDSTGGLWMKGALIGKVGSVFASTATQHGGQESTILSFHTTLLHHGMIIVGLPYSEQRQMTMSEISGGSPYGATTIASPTGDRTPSENELAMARFQGKHVAGIAGRLFR